jgi:hypothetical protein
MLHVHRPPQDNPSTPPSDYEISLPEDPVTTRASRRAVYLATGLTVLHGSPRLSSVTKMHDTLFSDFNIKETTTSKPL